MAAILVTLVRWLDNGNALMQSHYNEKEKTFWTALNGKYLECDKHGNPIKDARTAKFAYHHANNSCADFITINS